MGAAALLRAIEANKHFFSKYFNDLMRLICAAFLLIMALMTLAQCQQTAENWSNDGWALYGQGKYEEAIKAFDEAIKLDPNYANWNNKGNALYAQGNYDEAINACDEAIRLDPKRAVAYVTKAAALRAQGKYDEAIKACDEAIGLDPTNAGAWYNKGIALKATGRTAESDAAFYNAEELGYR